MIKSLIQTNTPEDHVDFFSFFKFETLSNFVIFSNYYSSGLIVILIVVLSFLFVLLCYLWIIFIICSCASVMHCIFCQANKAHKMLHALQKCTSNVN